MSEPELRVGSFAELQAETAYRIWQLRTSVFVVEQGCVYQELDGRDLEPSARHVWVEDGDEVIAYLRVLDEPDGVARIGRVCVQASARSHGWARRLMEAARAEIGERPSVLHAQAYLAPWYVGLGYQVTGPEFLDDGIPHVPMRHTP